MHHDDLETDLHRELIQRSLPDVDVGTVRTAAVCGDQEALRSWIESTAAMTPPLVDRVDGEVRRVLRGPDNDEALLLRHVVDPIRNRDTVRFTRIVVRVDVSRLLAPRAARVLEQPEKLPLLAIDADARIAAALETLLLTF